MRGQIIIPAKFVSTLVVITIATIMIAILFKAGAFMTIASYNKTQVERSIACDIAYLFSTWENVTVYPAIFSEGKLSALNQSYLEDRLFDQVAKYFFNPRYDFAIHLNYKGKNFSWYFPKESELGFETCAKDWVYLEYWKEMQKLFFPPFQLSPLLGVFESTSYSKIFLEKSNLSCELPAFISTPNSEIPEIGKIKVFYFENIATKLRNGFFQTIVNKQDLWFEDLGKYPEGCIDASFVGLPIHIHFGPINIDYDIGRLGCGFFWYYNKSEGTIYVSPSKSGASGCVIATRFPSYYYKNSSLNLSEKICNSKVVAPSLFEGFIAENKNGLHFFLKFYVLRREGDDDVKVCEKLCEKLYGKGAQAEHCKEGCKIANKTCSQLCEEFYEGRVQVEHCKGGCNFAEKVKKALNPKDTCYALCEGSYGKGMLGEYCKKGCNFAYGTSNPEEIISVCYKSENRWVKKCLEDIKSICYANSSCKKCVKDEECFAVSSCDISNPSRATLEHCYSKFFGESPCKDYIQYCGQGARYYFRAMEIKEGHVDAVYFGVLEDKLRKFKSVSEIPEEKYDWYAGSICSYEECSSSLECDQDKICISGQCVPKSEFKNCELWEKNPEMRNASCSPDYAPEYKAESNLFVYQKVYNLTWPYASLKDNTQEFCECLPKIEYSVNKNSVDCYATPNATAIWTFSIPKFRNYSISMRVWVNSDHKKVVLLNQSKTCGSIKETVCRGKNPKNGLSSFFLQVFFKERNANLSYILPSSIIKVK